MERSGEMRKCAEKRPINNRSASGHTHANWHWRHVAASGAIIWDKITPGFTVKSSFHLRKKMIRNFRYVRNVYDAATAIGGPVTNHAIFKIWSQDRRKRTWYFCHTPFRSPQMNLILLLHFLTPLIRRVLRVFWRRGMLKPSFSTWKAEIANSHTKGKLPAQNQTSSVEWHPKFIRSIIHAPSLSSK